MAQEAYFVSKKDLLQWINSTLSLNLTKVEQVCACFLYNLMPIADMPARQQAPEDPASDHRIVLSQTSSGAVACQLLDALQPGVVNMNKVGLVSQEQGICQSHIYLICAGRGKDRRLVSHAQ